MKPRSVVHVSSVHAYTDNRIHYRECISLSEAGYDVSLIAVESEIDAPDSAIRVLKISKRSRISRALISGIIAISLALRTRAKIVHLHDPELIPYIPILRTLGRRVIYDAHEDIPLQVLNKPYVGRWLRPILRVFAGLLVSVARSANIVVAATEPIAARFHLKRTVLVRNYPPLRQEEERDDVREDIAVYVGGLARPRGLYELLEAASDPRFPQGWTLHLAGRASAEDRLAIEEAARHGRVVFHGQIAPEAVRNLLLRAKVGLVTLHPTRAYMESLPTKMFEYFAASLAVVASDFPRWRQIMVDGSSGEFVDPSNAHAIVEAIREYADNSELLTRHRRSGRRLAVEKFNWDSEATKLIAAYERLRD